MNFILDLCEKYLDEKMDEAEFAIALHRAITENELHVEVAETLLNAYKR